MARFTKRIGETSFAPVTEETDALALARLTPALDESVVPGYFLDGTFTNLAPGQEDLVFRERDFGAETDLQIQFIFVPTYGEAPYTIRISASPHKKESEGDCSSGGTCWDRAPTYDLIELDHSVGIHSFFLQRWDYTRVSIIDSTGQKMPFDELFFDSYELQTSAYWVSKPIRLSSTLLEIADVRPMSYHPGISSLPIWNQTPQYRESNQWVSEFRGTRGSIDVTGWSSSLPTREEILREGIDGVRVRLTFVGGDSGSHYALIDHLEITYDEEYATQNPSKPVPEDDNNLYIPKLRVLLNTSHDVTQYVSEFSDGSLTLTVPDNRLDTLLGRNPEILVTLDENTAYEGRVVGYSKSTYATGNVYSLNSETYFDMLSNKMDEDIISTDLDGDGKMELPFADDLGYIAHVAQNIRGAGGRPVIYENQGFRPISAWYQGTGTEVMRKPVRLDSDYDWYQIYSTRNQTARGKLKQVAEANYYNLSSVAGRPLLAPMFPSPTSSVEQAAITTYNITDIGTYLPEARLYVPDFTYDPSKVPPKLEVQGLALAETHVGGDDQLTVAYANQEGSIRDYYLLESAGRDEEADWMFTDTDGNAIVFQEGTVEHEVRLRTDMDNNLCTDAKMKPVEMIMDTVNGYYGVVGLRLGIASGVFILSTLTARASGVLLYATTGERDEPPRTTSTGRYFPTWIGGQSVSAEFQRYGNVTPKDDEVVTNDFMTTYQLPPEDADIVSWNAELVANGQEPMYGQDEHGHYIELQGYRLHELALSKLADGYALDRLLNVMAIDFKYVGHAGLKHGDIFGIARRPRSGVNGVVEFIDYFMVMGDFKVAFTAGGDVTTSLRAGYVGTRELDTNTQTWSFNRELHSVDWKSSQTATEDVFFF